MNKPASETPDWSKLYEHGVSVSNILLISSLLDLGGLMLLPFAPPDLHEYVFQVASSLPLQNRQNP